MSRNYLTNINLNQNQLMNGVLQVLASAPASPVAGQVYYSSSGSYSATWNGTAWVPHDASKLSGTIPMSALTVDPTQRANHQGTQLANTISNLSTTVQAYPLSAFAAPTANIPMGGYTLTGLATPTAAGQAAEYAWVMSQVQNAAAGISSKDPVNALSVGNIASLSGTATVDGVALAVGQRVLLTGQTTGSQNGVWVVQTGTWTRPATEGGTGELDPGAQWLVLSGTVYAGTQWRMQTTGTITPGTTAVAIVQSQAAALYTAGAGLAMSGSAFVVNPVASGGILASSSGVQVDTTVVTRKYAVTIGDGSSTSYTVTHNLNTLDVQARVYQTASPYGDVEVDINHTSTTTVTVVFATAPASGAYRVVVMG